MIKASIAWCVCAFHPLLVHAHASSPIDVTMSLPSTLYRQLAGVLRHAQRHGVPVTGCVGMPQLSHVLCPGVLLRQLFAAKDAEGSLNGEEEHSLGCRMQVPST
jgi:hypothetical protein